MSDDKIINIQKLKPTATNSFSKEKLPFTQICNTVINECQNPVAGFIWIYLQSKCETWKPCKWEIMKRFNISESTYKRHMKYLTATNLIETHPIRNTKGQIIDWRILVLNGLKFNPKADNYKGVVHTVHVNQSIKNDTVENPSPNKDCSQKVTDDTLVNHQKVKNTRGSTFDPTYKERLTSLGKKEKDPPISPKGEKKELFSLKQMLEDNPHQIPESMISDWLEVRKSKRAKMTATAWKGTNSVLQNLRNSGLNPVECFESMVTSGWQGIKVSYFEKEIAATKKTPVIRPVDDKELREKLKQQAIEREQKEQEAKEREKKEAPGIMKNIKSTLAERMAQHEAAIRESGLSKDEYHAKIVNKRRLPEDSV